MKKLYDIRRYFYQLSPVAYNRDDDDRDEVGLNEYFVLSQSLEEALDWVKKQRPEDFNLPPAIDIKKESVYATNNYPFTYHDKWFGVKGSGKYSTDWYKRSETETKTVYERLTFGDWVDAGFRYVIVLREPFIEI